MKAQIILDGVVVLDTVLPSPKGVNPSDTFWVEFDYNTDLPRAVAATYEQLEKTWEKERKHLGTRYLRECMIVPQ